MSTDGIEDVYVQEGNVNGDIFLDFICTCLIPVVMSFNGNNPKSIVILDNASVHKGARIQEPSNEVGALLRFLLAYSADLNPIEEVFAEVKGKRWSFESNIIDQSIQCLVVYQNIIVCHTFIIQDVIKLDNSRDADPFAEMLGMGMGMRLAYLYIQWQLCKLQVELLKLLQNRPLLVKKLCFAQCA